MDWAEIKAELEYNRGYFPHAAVEAAAAQYGDIGRHLVEALARHAHDPAALAAQDESYFLHIYAMYLAAQLRDARPHADILALVSQPGEYPFEIIGDMVTEDLYAILARTCDGNVAGIKRLIEDPAANEYVRGAGLRALAAMVAAGEHPREQLVEYLRALFGSLPRDAGRRSEIWSQLVDTACSIQPGELIDEIERAYADRLVDPSFIAMKDVERARKRSIERALERHTERDPLDVNVESLESWACFHPDAGGEDEDGEYIEPYVRATPKVGRNEPCPCGSGKKYKRCCGASA